MVTVTANLEGITGLREAGTCIFRFGGFGASVPKASAPYGSQEHHDVVISTLVCKAVAD
jgi:hypothetical protein